MAFWSGNGGSIKVGSTTHNFVGKWTLRKNSRLTENTHSGTPATNYLAVVPDHSWTVEIPWDDTVLPDTDMGLSEGGQVTLTFNYGASGKFAVLTNTTVETIEEVDDNAQDIIRVVLSGKGGTLTRPVT